MNEINTESLPEIIEYFEDLEPWMLDSHKASYEIDSRFECGACVGAHLANIFGIATGEHTDFIRGSNELAERMGYQRNFLYNPLHYLEVDLRYFGAPMSPFGYFPWRTLPEQVFRKLMNHYDRA